MSTNTLTADGPNDLRSDVLDLGDVVPGFACTIADIMA